MKALLLLGLTLQIQTVAFAGDNLIGQIKCEIQYKDFESQFYAGIKAYTLSTAEIRDYCRNASPNENEPDCQGRLTALAATPYRIEHTSNSGARPEEVYLLTGTNPVASLGALGNYGITVDRSGAVARALSARGGDAAGSTVFYEEFRELSRLNGVPKAFFAVGGRIRETFNYAVVDLATATNKFGVKFETATIQCDPDYF